MNTEAIKNSILFVLEKAKDREISIGKTRLIKMLYLLDVEYFRQSQMKFSGLNWIFYKYGPYAFELEDILREIDINEEEIVLTSEKIFKKYSYGDEITLTLPIEVKATLEKILESWGTADLNDFLEYIYFDTEPMSSPKFKDPLDFSKIKQAEPPLRIVLSRDERTRLGQIGINIKERLNKIMDTPSLIERLPDEFSARVFCWEEDFVDVSSIKGKVRL